MIVTMDSTDATSKKLSRVVECLENWYSSNYPNGWVGPITDKYPNGWMAPVADKTLVLDGISVELFPDQEDFDMMFALTATKEYNSLYLGSPWIDHYISEMICRSISQSPIQIDRVLITKRNRLAERTVIVSKIPYTCVPLIHAMHMFWLGEMGIPVMLEDGDKIRIRKSNFIYTYADTKTIGVNLNDIDPANTINSAAWMLQIILAFTEYFAELVGFNRVVVINADRFFEKDTHWLRRYILENRRQLDIVVW